MNLPAKYPSLNATRLSEEAQATLIRILRVAFPHPGFPDGPYTRTAAKIVAEAAASTWFRIELVQGLATLNAAADERRFVDLSDEEALAILHLIEDSVFFGFIRRTTVLNFYDDPEVWAAIGYEGSSFEQGGYINRGFNDLDWLPEPRIEEADGAVPDQGALPYRVAAARPAAAVPAATVPAIAVSDGAGSGAAPAAAAAGPDEMSGVGPSTGSARRKSRSE